MAQLVAHPLDVREVTSSSLVSSTMKNRRVSTRRFFSLIRLAASFICCASDIGFTSDIGFASSEANQISLRSNLAHHAAAGSISLRWTGIFSVRIRH